MLEKNQSTAAASPAPVPSNGAARANKMVLFGVEVDAPEGQDTGVVHAPLPKARGAFMPIIMGLTFFALIGVAVFMWNAATNAEKELEHRTAALKASTEQAQQLQTRLTEATDKVRALDAEKATLTADLTAKTEELTKANELLTAKGKKK
jgi:cytoskeletal protein RodZ